MTAQWKRRAQRAEEQEALVELAAYDREAALQRLRAARAKSTITEEEALAVLGVYDDEPEDVGSPFEALIGAIPYVGLPAAYDPRGRVTVICGRCGQPALSETTPTILAHYTEAHGKAPRQMVLGRFEERCEVTR